MTRAQVLAGDDLDAAALLASWIPLGKLLKFSEPLVSSSVKWVQ